MAVSKISYIPLDGIKFKKISVEGTTDSSGKLTVANTTGTSYVYLLKSTYNDGVGSSFGVINMESATASTITLRFRTLKDGSAAVNTHIQMALILAY